MKKLKYLALYIFLTGNVLAGWNTNVWPSTNHFRFTNSAEYVIFTNEFVGLRITTAFTATAAATNLPGYDVDGYLYDNPDTSGYWSSGGAASYEYGVALPTVYVDTNSTSSATTFTITNQFWTSIGYSTNYAILYKKDFTITNYWESVIGGITNGISESYVGTATNIVITNIALNIKDLRILDSYLAIKERVDALGGAYPNVPTFFRKDYQYAGRPEASVSERDNLIEHKEWVVYSVNGFDWIDLGAYGTNYTTNSVLDNFLTNNVNANVSSAELTISNLCGNLSLPANYFDFTPYRQLNGVGYPYGHLVTQSWTLVGAGSVTNTVVDYSGVTHTLTGTGGVEVNTIATNDVLDGWSELDYGWKHWTNVVAQLVQTWSSAGDVDGSGTNGFGVSNDGSWSAAIADVTDTPLFTAIYGTIGAYDPKDFPDGLQQWLAYSYQSEWLYKLAGLPTNINKSVEFYVKPVKIALSALYTNNSVFDANGYDITENEMRWWSTSGMTNTATVYAQDVLGSGITVPTWAIDPDNGSTNQTARGFSENAATRYFVIKWDFDYE